jgi:hypothetical protein
VQSQLAHDFMEFKLLFPNISEEHLNQLLIADDLFSVVRVLQSITLDVLP